MTRLRQQRPRLLRAIAHRRQGGVAGMHRRHQVMLRRLTESPEGEAGDRLDIDGEPQRTAHPRIVERLVVDLHLQQAGRRRADAMDRSEEHTSELQSLMRISYAVFCLKKK